MGQRTTFLIVTGDTPREAVYWHWWCDNIEDLAGDLLAIPEMVVRAVHDADGLGTGKVGELLRQRFPRFTAQQITAKDLREDVAWVDPDEVVMHAAMGEVCVIVDLMAPDLAMIDAVIANPTVRKLRGYLGMTTEGVTEPVEVNE